MAHGSPDEGEPRKAMVTDQVANHHGNAVGALRGDARHAGHPEAHGHLRHGLPGREQPSHALLVEKGGNGGGDDDQALHVAPIGDAVGDIGGRLGCNGGVDAVADETDDAEAQLACAGLDSPPDGDLVRVIELRGENPDRSLTGDVARPAIILRPTRRSSWVTPRYPFSRPGQTGGSAVHRFGRDTTPPSVKCPMGARLGGSRVPRGAPRGNASLLLAFVARVVAEELPEDTRQLRAGHQLLLDKIPADWLVPCALQPQDPCDLLRAQKAESTRRFAGLLVAAFCAQDVHQVTTADCVELLGELSELGLRRSLPDNGSDQALPRDTPRIIEELRQPKTPPGERAVIVERASRRRGALSARGTLP